MSFQYKSGGFKDEFEVCISMSLLHVPPSSFEIGKIQTRSQIQ
jgi:hypothetical protein